MTKAPKAIHEDQQDSAGRSVSEPMDERSESCVAKKENEQGPTKKKPKRHTASSKRMGRLLLVIVGGFGGCLFMVYFPGFLAYQYNGLWGRC